MHAPDGREWHVRVYRLRLPRWRQFQPLFSEEPAGLGILFVVDLVLAFISAVVGLVVSVLFVVVQLLVNAFRAVVSDDRTVEASSRAPQAMRLTWRTDAAHVAAVADQVARQLELGYNRVQAHNADFEGFADA